MLIDSEYAVSGIHRSSLRRHDGQTLPCWHADSGVLILQKLAAGISANDILRAYPQLNAEHIQGALEYVQGALEYAAQLAAEEIVLWIE